MTEALENFALKQKAPRKKGSVHKVAVIGCGNIGQEIARIVAYNGMEVIFIDLTEERIVEVYKEIEIELDSMIDRWGLTLSEKRVIMSRIKGSTDYEDIKDVDLVIESINSQKPGTNISLRKEIFAKAESVVSEDTIITSNNSTLMISDLAAVLKIPERAVGFHFIGPASSIKVVEVVRGLQTSDYAYDFMLKFAKTIDKRAITLHESPGHISTRLIVTLINEACETLMEGVATVKCIDTTMKLGYGMMFGPFEMADRIGLDKLLRWMDNLYAEFGLQKFKASPILKRLVRAGYTGRYNNKGFYTYKDGKIIEEAIHISEFK
ncbi:MAG: 3-hydroxyacyl-CoA dehydrogenase family protein [Bacteroidales bacterium]|nr:3-hydroxyacyl-CoA dehydrogenase family protein [Bacteroidales bacterium]MCF8391738.1 3-hydroxyacyl-CoA dehydrogenase family protein [Bacteroidales bacterium]